MNKKVSMLAISTVLLLMMATIMPVLAPTQPPIADADGPYEGYEGSPITFDASGSSDPDGQPLQYEWDFGDGSTGTGVSPTHTYISAGTYTVTLTVTDPDGNTDTDSTTVTVNPVIILVYVDIKPGSWPNPLNLKSKGIVTVAILGLEDFDVMTIDPASVRISLDLLDELTLDTLDDIIGVAPLRWSYEDVSRPSDFGGDGFVDLVLKFKTQELREITLTKYEHGETVPLTISGNLKEEYDGSLFIGQDFLVVLHPNG